MTAANTSELPAIAPLDERSVIAVTGATGFIGRYLVRALVGRGARVIGVVRNPDKVPSLAANPGVELRRADLKDRDALARAFEGVDAVISNAGLISIGGQSQEALMKINAEGTRNVFEAMRLAGVSRAVMTSSSVVYRPRRGGGAYVETDPLFAPGDRVGRFARYAFSKACAEREAWRLCEREGITLSVARPGGVYGAFDRNGFTIWFGRLMRLPITPFPIAFRVPNVYAADLAETMLRMLERPAARDRAYNISGDPEISYWEMMRAFGLAGGKTPRIAIPLPVPISIRYDVSRARRDLDFSNRAPHVAFADALAFEDQAMRAGDEPGVLPTLG